jgi:hypothetical protein
MISIEAFINLQNFFVCSKKPPLGRLLSRYEILPRYAILDIGRSVPFQTYMYRLGRNLLISLGLVKPINCNEKWVASLKHVPSSPNASLVLVWAVNFDNAVALKQACLILKEQFLRSKLLPVLITNHAHFSFYSRLGWLVEYLPDLPGSGESYSDRKLAYLAWRYQAAVVLPLSAGLMADGEFEVALGKFLDGSLKASIKESLSESLGESHSKLSKSPFADKPL